MIRRKYAAGLADDVVHRLALKPYKVDPRHVAEKLGATVVGIKDPTNGGSGMVARDGDRIIIGVNEFHAVTRQRFTIAHEIGHMLLHASEPLIVDRQFALIGERRDDAQPGSIREIEANAFAAALLMPQEWILKAVDGNETDVLDDDQIEKLAAMFGVSTQAMTYRLINLGLMRNV